FDLQSPEQPSALWLLPSSQTSPCAGSVTLSPQRGSWQVGRHGASGAVEFAAPESHSSPIDVSVTPSPQRGCLQSCWQLSPSCVLPSSHCSPAAVSMVPLPHDSFDWQSAEQPSPETLLPSSHTSSGVTT